MHQWESLKKLISEWEAQEVKDPFVYEQFKYNADEWDNVPPVLPRFQFYMQNCLDKTVAFTKEVNERQTTHQLKSEMDDKFEKANVKLMNEETRRKKDIDKASKREDKL